MGSEKRARPVPAEEETDGGGSGPPTKRARVSSSLHRANEPSRSIEPARQQVYQRPGVPPPTDLGSFVVPDRFSPPSRPDDSEGHYVYQLGENISSRFKILAKLGEGTFGRVLECWDRKTHNRVAVKIVRNVQKYRDAAMIELEVLNTLERNDPSGSHHCVALVEWFDYRGHVCMDITTTNTKRHNIIVLFHDFLHDWYCWVYGNPSATALDHLPKYTQDMVFKKLGASLYDFLRRNHYEAFELPLVRAFLRQLLEATLYLHDLHIIHTDLKPENILVEACDPEPEGNEPRMVPRLPPSTDIKVIDLGSATFDEQYHSTVVSTRHYRAPEVILGLGWSFPADMWSIGCIIAELATGDALFQTHENLEHLAMMEQILGRMPKHMVKAASRAAQKMFHHRTSELLWPGSASKRSIRTVDKLVPVKRLLATSSRPSVRPQAEQLGDLIEQLLNYDPAQRMTARQALRHPFFHEAEPGD